MDTAVIWCNVSMDEMPNGSYDGLRPISYRDIWFQRGTMSIHSMA